MSERPRGLIWLIRRIILSRWFALLLIALAVVLNVFVYWVTATVEGNALCTGELMCHWMAPAYKTWEAGKHNRWNCHICHKGELFSIMLTESWKTFVLGIPRSSTCQSFRLRRA